MFTPSTPTQSLDSTGVRLAGVILSVAHHDIATGFFVAKLWVGSHAINIVGTSMLIAPGMKVLCDGQPVTHSVYGKQFRVKSMIVTNMGDAMLMLLRSGFLTGIKVKKAELLYQSFGADTFEMLDKAIENPSVLYVVKGIKKVVANQIIQSWKSQRDWAQAALVSAKAGLTMSQAKKAHSQFGTELANIILTNAYRLTIVYGITWARADEIAQMEWPGKVPIGHNDPRRFAAALREVLEQAYGQGHMTLAKTEAIAKAQALAQPTVNTFEVDVLAHLLDEEMILHNAGWLYLKRNYGIEMSTAAMIRAKQVTLRDPLIEWDGVATRLNQYSTHTLSDDQVAAVEIALDHPLVVITGGPGTGKTTILATICNILEDHGESFTLCAPTGKAARRISEATSYAAGTIHRTLGLYGDLIKECFRTHYVLIDESSMVDASLMRTVLEACQPDPAIDWPGSRLILIGDVDQLPPVGAGEPFYQIIQAGVPTARLTQIHRQGKDSGIVHLAHAFNTGHVADVGGFEDVSIQRVSNNESLPAAALKTINDLSQRIRLNNIQVLTPVNGTDYGQLKLNEQLQETYNPGPFSLKGLSFKKDDKVIHIHNVYDLHNRVVFNGMVGLVTWIADEEGERHMLHMQEELGKEEMPIVLCVLFDGDTISAEYTREEAMHYLRLAYALTIHKSQGSEYENVVMLAPSVYEGFMLRQLVYTGLTRAKQTAVIITANTALERYVQNAQRVRRFTHLASMIQE